MKNDKPYVLVTGGSGFIGSHAVEELLALGKNVIILDPDPPLFLDKEIIKSSRVVYKHGTSYDLPQLLDITKNFQLEGIFDIGGVLGTEELSHRIDSAIAFNVVGSTNILEIARINDLKVFFPMKEGIWLDGYSLTKNTVLHQYKIYRKMYGIETVVCIWYHAYGERQGLFPIRKAVPSFIAQALCGEKMTIMNDPKNALDLIYVKDVGKLVTRLFYSDKINFDEVYEIGTGTSISLEDLVELIKRLTNSSSEVDYIRYRETLPEHPFGIADITKFEKVLGRHNFMPIEEGIKITVDWYKNNYTIDQFMNILELWKQRHTFGV